MQETDINLLRNKLPVAEHFEKEVLSVSDYRGDLTLVVRPEAIRAILTVLKGPGSFELLLDLFGMDYLKSCEPHPERFAVIYNLYSISTRKRVRLKAYLPEGAPALDSVHDLYACVNWFEREAWDMFGIQFRGHPNLARILCHHEFVGHPLRKDYPSDGYQQLKKAAAPEEL